MLSGFEGFGEVSGLVVPRSASRPYVMPFTCSTSPLTIAPNWRTRPSAGERRAFWFGSRGRTPGFRVR